MATGDALPIPRKGVAYRVTFPLLDADGDLVSGATTDSEVSKDAGTFADCTNEATEIATSSGVYYLDLTSTEMNADCVAVIVKSGTSKTTVIVLYPEEPGDIRVNATTINGSANAAARLALSAGAMIPGTVDNTAHSPTTTEFEADDITEATADHYNGRLVLWTSGALLGQVTDVVDYALVSGRAHFTVAATTEAPGNNDTFILV